MIRSFMPDAAVIVKIGRGKDGEDAHARIPARPPLDCTRKWAVVELPSMAHDHLSLTPGPHITILHIKLERFSATFQFGAQRGEIDGSVAHV